jgi:hypothetical protein
VPSAAAAPEAGEAEIAGGALGGFELGGGGGGTLAPLAFGGDAPGGGALGGFELGGFELGGGGGGTLAPLAFGGDAPGGGGTLGLPEGAAGERELGADGGLEPRELVGGGGGGRELADGAGGMPSMVDFGERTTEPSRSASGSKGSSARRTCCAENGRSRGSFESNEDSSFCALAGQEAGGSGAGCSTWAASTFLTSSSAKGGEPVASSYSRQPSA